MWQRQEAEGDQKAREDQEGNSPNPWPALKCQRAGTGGEAP